MEVIQMVGRPSPIYKGYNPKDKNKEEEDDLEKQKEELLKERAQLQKRAEIRGIKKEMFDLEHPRYTETKKRASTAKERILGFAGGLIQEGIRATRPRKVTKGGVRRKRSMAYPSVFHPVSTDISLTKAIAMNNWSGENTGIMERDFFGVGSDQKELLGDRNKDINIGSNIHQQFFGDKENMDLIGSKTKDIELLGTDKKSKKIQYI